MGRNKEGIPIKCQHCGYEWLTKSKMFYVCCPRCMYRVKNVVDDKAVTNK